MIAWMAREGLPVFVSLAISRHRTTKSSNIHTTAQTPITPTASNLKHMSTINFHIFILSDLDFHIQMQEATYAAGDAWMLLAIRMSAHE